MNKLENTFKKIKTPFYWYDMELLTKTLEFVKKETEKYDFHVHYAVKANTNKPILKKMIQYGLGADCVSGNEILYALETGFSPKDIVFAGVGKTDEEIKIGLENDIFAFNIESIQEIEVINTLAQKLNKSARIALRLNPNVDAVTHKYITTGLNENKFGINLKNLDDVFSILKKMNHLELTGIHFHIGSQITDFRVFKNLCFKVNEIQELFVANNIQLTHINLGGGLGINYKTPSTDSIPDFKTYFKTFADYLEKKPNQQIHFELGRSIVGQCGNLITHALYVKKGTEKEFVIVDAGLTELIRPALYEAKHQIKNLSSELPKQTYDVVGPICESADVFIKNIQLPKTKRGDLLAIKSVGAYGQVMTSQYNLRTKAKAYYSDNKIE